jgi:hypothetical protein
MHCEETCIQCGNDIGPHHLCTDCLEGMSNGCLHEAPQGENER